MTRPNVILWALAAAAAGALALPGAWVLLVLIPAAVAVAAAWWPHKPKHAAPRPAPVYVSATITQLWLYGPGAATGSMDLTAELAWRRQYQIPDSVLPTGMESGSGPPIGAPAPRPYLVPFEARPPGWPREQLERLADTGDHHGLAAALERLEDFEQLERDKNTYLAGLAARAAEIRQAALAGWQ